MRVVQTGLETETILLQLTRHWDYRHEPPDLDFFFPVLKAGQHWCTQKAEAGEFLNLRLSWFTERVLGQPGLQREALT